MFHMWDCTHLMTLHRWGGEGYLSVMTEEGVGRVVRRVLLNGAYLGLLGEVDLKIKALEMLNDPFYLMNGFPISILDIQEMEVISDIRGLCAFLQSLKAIRTLSVKVDKVLLTNQILRFIEIHSGLCDFEISPFRIES